ncbi:adenosine 5'-monophosphoramidase HINT3-like isoform X2 [Paralichthys olivaceus]|uniref:adenosine 5'-monophosphoramidase HINT3-like isoform X2 n=1 Tax=Paralichthys olivaceus TaxID=8255 RepID=UPI00097DA0DE|nr:PREDICTED: histidine triad nucleotide-binding protein 3-like isoform X2 [Paralichthys olivaceus]
MESDSDVCSFCRIANHDTDTDILLSDEQLVCFRDVKPGATHHYLIVPRMHIDNCKALQGTDVPLVEQMEKMGRSILEKNNISDLDDVCKMSFRSQLHYTPKSHWFITVDKVLSQLKTHGKVK